MKKIDDEEETKKTCKCKCTDWWSRSLAVHGYM